MRISVASAEQASSMPSSGDSQKYGDYTAPLGEPLMIPTKEGGGTNGQRHHHSPPKRHHKHHPHQQSNGISPNIHSNKKQVSFHKEDELLTYNTDKEAIAVSQRSVESFASSTEGTSSSVDPSPNSSMRSYDSSGRTTVSIPSLHSSLTRTLKHRDPLRYYEILKVLGDGSMGSVSKVKKRKSAIGGSARRKFVEEESMHSVSKEPLKMFQKCFIFCFPGSKENTKQNALDAMDEEDEEQHKLRSINYTKLIKMRKQ